jgi:outer membrane immunogenic protein
VRARVGRASGPALLYFTGGLAYGEVSSSGRVAGRTIGVFTGTTINTFAGSFDSRETKIGWTLGTGLEAQLAGNWSLKTEYLYVDLGDVTNTFNTIFLTGGAAGGVAATRTITTEIKEHIFRAGLNYKFGDYGKGPVVTKY